MPRIEQDNLIANCGLDPERINFIRGFYSLFDYRTIGANRRITNVEPLYYIGATAGTEFLVYAATKLYLTLKFFKFSYSGSNPSFLSVTFYDESNNSINSLYDGTAYWDATAAAARYCDNSCFLKNFYFSRLVTNAVHRIIFNGYRITLA